MQKFNWSKSILKKIERSKETLIEMLTNGDEFEGFQGFVKVANIEMLDEIVPDTFEDSKTPLVIVGADGELEQVYQTITWREYCPTHYLANDNKSVLMFMPNYRYVALDDNQVRAFVDKFGIENVYTLSSGRDLRDAEYVVTEDFIESFTDREVLKAWIREREIDSEIKLTLSLENMKLAVFQLLCDDGVYE